jgi:hypothetical protein
MLERSCNLCLGLKCDCRSCQHWRITKLTRTETQFLRDANGPRLVCQDHLLATLEPSVRMPIKTAMSSNLEDDVVLLAAAHVLRSGRRKRPAPRNAATPAKRRAPPAIELSDARTTISSGQRYQFQAEQFSSELRTADKIANRTAPRRIVLSASFAATNSLIVATSVRSHAKPTYSET